MLRGPDADTYLADVGGGGQREPDAIDSEDDVGQGVLGATADL